MERVTRVVKIGEAEGASHVGEVEIGVPNYDERLAILIDIEEAGGSLKEEASKRERYLYYKAVSRHLPKFVSRVAIKRIEDGFEFQSFDSLQADTEMGAVLTALCLKLVESFQVGKQK